MQAEVKAFWDGRRELWKQLENRQMELHRIPKSLCRQGSTEQGERYSLQSGGNACQLYIYQRIDT